MFVHFDFVRYAEKAFAVRGLKRAMMCGSALALVLGSAPASVQAQQWTNGSGDSNWGQSGNWTGGVVPNGRVA